MKLSANHLALLIAGAGAIGAIAPEPMLLLAAHVGLLLGGIQIVRLVESPRHT